MKHQQFFLEKSGIRTCHLIDESNITHNMMNLEQKNIFIVIYVYCHSI
jgi:hypothetical protein